MNIAVSKEVTPDHDPDLYTKFRTAEFVDDIIEVDENAIRFFHAHGYLAISQAIPIALTSAGENAIDDLIDGQRKDFRGVQFESGLGEKANLTNDQRRLGVRKLMHFVGFDLDF